MFSFHIWVLHFKMSLQSWSHKISHFKSCSDFDLETINIKDISFKKTEQMCDEYSFQDNSLNTAWGANVLINERI